MQRGTPYEIPGARRFDAPGVDDVVLSVYEVGEPIEGRPSIVLSHGFPELAYSWRAQLRTLGDAGWHVIAPDQRGYGGSGRPEPVTDYDIFHLTGDLTRLLDARGVEQAVFVGHDWGGFVVWQMPFLHRDRVAGVVGVNTPYTGRFPMKPTELFRMVGGDNFYIVWFQTPEVPDAKLAAHTEQVFRSLLRRGADPGDMAAQMASLQADPSKDFVDMILAGGALGGPEAFLSDAELAVFVDTFTETGFTGGINWYRNFDRNWELTPEQDGARIDGVPCLMVTASWDPVLRPEMAAGMPAVIGDLEMHEIPECGHWTQQEKPAELDAILLDWLGRRFPPR